MADVPNKNAPLLGGWVIAAGMGAVALGVARVIGSFDWTPAVAIAGVITLSAGLVMGMPWGQGDAGAASVARPAALDLPAAPSQAPAAGADAAPAPAAPAAAAPVAFASVSQAPSAPEVLSAPRGGKADDLKVIEGIGPALEKMINGLGVFHFDQIAGWSEADVAFFDARMDRFKGRIARDKWVAQARIIVTEGLERFQERARTNDY